MALVLQNRAEPELREMLTKFMAAMAFQHELQVDYAVIGGFSNHIIEQKVQKLIGDWLNELSIPELMKIKDMCIDATQKSREQPQPQAVKPAEKVKKKHLQ